MNIKAERAYNARLFSDYWNLDVIHNLHSLGAKNYMLRRDEIWSYVLMLNADDLVKDAMDYKRFSYDERNNIVKEISNKIYLMMGEQ